MPKLTPQNYAQALYEAIQETSPKDHDLVMDKFVKVLAENGDLGKYDQIEAEFHKFQLSSQGIKQAEVTVAREMEINRTIIQELNEAVGGKLEIKQKVDEGIIGGVVVRVDDTLIDASVKGQLETLNKNLKS